MHAERKISHSLRWDTEELRKRIISYQEIGDTWLFKMAKESTQKNKGGRPPKFATLEDLGRELKKYFDSCIESRTMPTKAGLCLFLHISRDTYNEYKKKKEFSDALKGTELYLEDAWIQRLAGNSPTGAIFYLKNAFKEEYKDRHETDVTSGGKPIESTSVKVMNEEQIDEYLRNKLTGNTSKSGGK